MDVEVVARFVAADQRQQLVDGEIDFRELKARMLAANRGQEAPGRIVRPFELGRFLAFAHDCAREPRLLQQYFNLVARLFEQSPIFADRHRDSLLRIVEVIEVVAVPLGVGLDVHRRAAS